MKPEFIYKATLLSVYDGDTVTVSVDLGMHVSVRAPLRLVGIDAPEMGTDAGRAAKEHLRGLCAPPLVIRTYKDPGDKYGRWLATVVNGQGVNVNAQMVEDGHAKPYDGGARG